MEMNNKNTKGDKPFRTLKSASPETLFARFLQKQSKSPSMNQIATWELDGGQIPDYNDKCVIVHGYLCSTFSEKVQAHITYYWRLLKLYLLGRQTQYRK